MNRETGEKNIHHIDKAVYLSEKESRFPIETETKIKYLGSREEFIGQMEELGAKLEAKTRLIDDLRFKAGKNYSPGKRLILNAQVFPGIGGRAEPQQMRLALELLGFGVEESPDGFVITAPDSLDNATVRIRNDGGVWIFTAKKRLEQPAQDPLIEEKPEVEVELESAAGLQDFLEKDLGLEIDSHRQKFRTSYRLKSGQLVELNESPAFTKHSVPFWLEIEAKNKAEIQNAAKQLGFDSAHFFKGSDKKYLTRVGGMDEKQTKDLKF